MVKRVVAHARVVAGRTLHIDQAGRRRCRAEDDGLARHQEELRRLPGVIHGDGLPLAHLHNDRPRQLRLHRRCADPDLAEEALLSRLPVDGDDRSTAGDPSCAGDLPRGHVMRSGHLDGSHCHSRPDPQPGRKSDFGHGRRRGEPSPTPAHVRLFQRTLRARPELAAQRLGAL